MPFSFHRGAIDSQTPPEFEAPVAGEVLGERAAVTIHPRRGHSLGEHATCGPMDEEIADSQAEELATRGSACGAG